ncbi:hypothetical protein ABK040_010821 [Willaertia magna]
MSSETPVVAITGSEMNSITHENTIYNHGNETTNSSSRKFTLEDTEKYGHTMIAKQDLSFGEIVYIDEPLFTWPTNENENDYVLGIYKSFKESSIEKQNIIIKELYSPPELENELINKYKTIFLEKHQETEINHFVKVVASATINSYQCSDKEVAFYPFGSKTAHSCKSNCNYFLNDKKQLVVKAIKTIKKNEIISLSYINDNDRLKSTKCRDKIIFKNRYFHCNCERCSTFDDCRYLKCISCKDGKLIKFCNTLQDDFNNKLKCWKCDSCKKEFTDMEMKDKIEKENNFEILLNKLTEQKDNVKELELLEKQCLEYLNNNHWIIIKINYLLFEKSLYQSYYLKSIHSIRIDCLQKIINFVKTIKLFPIFIDVFVGWCLLLNKCLQFNKKLNDPMVTMIKKIILPFIKDLYPYWRMYFGYLDKDVIELAIIGNICVVCGKDNATKCCGNCKRITYCSAECQTNHWKQHRLECKKK